MFRTVNTSHDTDPAPTPEDWHDDPGPELAPGFRCTLKVEPYCALDCPRCESSGKIDSGELEETGITTCYACGGSGVRLCEAFGYACGATVHRLVRCAEHERAICNAKRCFADASADVMLHALRSARAAARMVLEAAARRR